jgi:hypothetical protein
VELVHFLIESNSFILLFFVVKFELLAVFCVKSCGYVGLKVELILEMIAIMMVALRFNDDHAVVEELMAVFRVRVTLNKNQLSP